MTDTHAWLEAHRRKNQARFGRERWHITITLLPPSVHAIKQYEDP